MCTVHQDKMTEQLQNIPDMPCSEVSMTLDDGQFVFTCKMGIQIRASGAVQVDNCQLDIEITEGTLGAADVVQLLIDQLLPKLPYEKICFDQATIDDGQLVLAGYGR